MAVNDIYEVTDVQTLNSQQVLNVYFYEQRAAFVPLAGSTAQALADEWVESVLPAILACQTTDLVHVEVRVRNLFDASDAGIAVAGATGVIIDAAGTLPPFNAFGFQLNTDNAGIRPGSKRLAGVAEFAQNDGVPDAAILVTLNTAADTMAEPITGGLIIEDDIMFPVVVQRVRTGVPGAYEYRLPETSGEATVGLIIETLVKMLITSQISRKVGVGI